MSRPTFSARIYDAPGRYHVDASDPEAPPYLCDLLAHDTRGECTCADWQMRIGNHYAAGTEPPKTRCKHLIEAREQFANDVLAKLLATMKAGL